MCHADAQPALLEVEPSLVGLHLHLLGEVAARVFGYLGIEVVFLQLDRGLVPVSDRHLQHGKDHRVGPRVFKDGMIACAAAYQQRWQGFAKGHFLFQVFGPQREVEELALVA